MCEIWVVGGLLFGECLIEIWEQVEVGVYVFVSWVLGEVVVMWWWKFGCVFSRFISMLGCFIFFIICVRVVSLWWVVEQLVSWLVLQLVVNLYWCMKVRQLSRMKGVSSGGKLSRVFLRYRLVNMIVWKRLCFRLMWEILWVIMKFRVWVFIVLYMLVVMKMVVVLGMLMLKVIGLVCLMNMSFGVLMLVVVVCCFRVMVRSLWVFVWLVVDGMVRNLCSYGVIQVQVSSSRLVNQVDVVCCCLVFEEMRFVMVLMVVIMLISIGKVRRRWELCIGIMNVFFFLWGIIIFYIDVFLRFFNGLFELG